MHSPTSHNTTLTYKKLLPYINILKVRNKVIRGKIGVTLIILDGIENNMLK
jgi:hypothetical protein